MTTPIGITNSIPDPVRAHDLQPLDSIRMLLYGEQGTGKTRFAATCGDRALIINTGFGTTTLTSPSVKKLGNPLVITVTEEMDKVTGIFKTAKAFDLICDIMDKWEGSDEIDTIIIDDATFLGKLAMNKALELNFNSKKSHSLTNSRKNGMMELAGQDFGEQMGVIDWFLYSYSQSMMLNKKHLIITAHERLVYEKTLDQNGKPVFGEPATLTKVTPGFYGEKFPGVVMGYFDFIWHSEMDSGGDNRRYRFRTIGNEVIAAKSRYSGIFKEMEVDTNFLSILARIKKANEEGKLIDAEKK